MTRPGYGPAVTIVALVWTAVVVASIMFWIPLFSYSYHYWLG